MIYDILVYHTIVHLGVTTNSLLRPDVVFKQMYRPVDSLRNKHCMRVLPRRCTKHDQVVTISTFTLRCGDCVHFVYVHVYTLKHLRS